MIALWSLAGSAGTARAAGQPARLAVDLLPQEGGTQDDGPPGQADTAACDANLSNLSQASGAGAWQSSDVDDVNTVNLVCTTVADASGTVLSGTAVTLTSSGAGSITDASGTPISGSSQTVSVSPDGYAAFHVLSTKVGTQSLVFTAGSLSRTGTQSWRPPGRWNARLIECVPGQATANAGAQQQVTCTVTDGLENAVPDVPVAWSASDAGGAMSSITPPSTTTDASGNVVASVASPSAGTTTIAAWSGRGGSGPSTLTIGASVRGRSAT